MTTTTEKKFRPPYGINAAYEGLKGVKGRDLLSISDLNKDEISNILYAASHMKERIAKGDCPNHLYKKCVALYFEKQSTRTRMSFENGILRLGGLGTYLNKETSGLQLGRGESIEDTIGVMDRFYDALVFRLFKHEDLVKMANLSSKPVINALTDLEHPCQVLADLLTILEHKGNLHGLTLAYFGDGNNVAHSLMLGAAIMGMDIRVASPKGYRPLEEIRERASVLSGRSNSVIWTANPKDAAKGADIIYTDTWVSMGQENDPRIKEKKMMMEKYRVNTALMKLAKKNAIFMHDMPAHRGDEVTAEVMDGPQSVHLDQAENRMHAQNALLVGLLIGAVEPDG